MPSTIPNTVATPLPPRKSAQMGNICPITAVSPNPICKLTKSVSLGMYCGSNKASFTAASPFNMSSIITNVPQVGPSTRYVLVAPGLPLPYSRISISKNQRLIQTDVGMLPIRKARIMINSSFMELLVEEGRQK